MTESTYCLDSDVIIWHLRKGERQRAVDALLEKLATTGARNRSGVGLRRVS